MTQTMAFSPFKFLQEVRAETAQGHVAVAP